MTNLAGDPERLNELTLAWHAGSATIEMEAFRLWALTGLAARIPFDGAIWGSTAEAGAAYFFQTDPAVLQGPSGESFALRLASVSAGRVVRLDAADPRGASQSRVDEPARPDEHARMDEPAALPHSVPEWQHGLDSAIGVRFGDPVTDAAQFLALRRGAGTGPFDAHDSATFEWLAPHMMSAFANCRKLQLNSGAGRASQGPVRASAIVDRAGRIHESDPRFVRTLRREWTDWTGRKLPDALLNHKSRKVASRWQFLGRQIIADFVPVNDLFLVVARPRLAADALTAREWDIARRYASGSEYKEVAEALQVSPATVRSHLRRVFSKLKVRNKSELAASIG